MDVVNTESVLYCDWGVESMKEGENVDDEQDVPVSTSSSFTAVNRQWPQLLTPQSTASVPINQDHARPRASGQSRRRHNPAVAQYLGLGNSNEPIHPEKYAPLSAVPESPPLSPARKRRRLADGENTLRRTRISANRRDSENQRSVCESFRVTKHACKSASTKAKMSGFETSRAPSAYALDSHTKLTDRDLDTILHQDQSVHSAHGTGLMSDISSSNRVTRQDTVTGQQLEDLIDRQLFDQEIDEYYAYGSVQFDFKSMQYQVEESEFDDSDLDDALLMLSSEFDGTVFNHVNDVSGIPVESSIQAEDTDQHHTLVSCADTTIDVEEDTGPSRSQCMLKDFVSPVTLASRLLASASLTKSIEGWKPFARSPFPDPVRDRSPIIGLSSSTRLRTCFRIGEAVNQSYQALKSGKHITIELYARVLDSNRVDTKQNFTFCDLFHAKPPYIKAVYEAIIWKPVQLFEYDSRRLLQEGRICRCIGTMKQDGKAWVMTVLNIWEATLEDIKWVEGIINPY
ncbi:Nn.00g085540.m01.CDS01 [Neocucurbitaria sp. VM-36]